MIVTISNDMLILIGLLTFMFMPQLHLIFIFTINAIIEEFGKLCEKIIKFALDYILPATSLYLLCLLFLKMITYVCNDINYDYNDVSETI